MVFIIQKYWQELRLPNGSWAASQKPDKKKCPTDQESSKSVSKQEKSSLPSTSNEIQRTETSCKVFSKMPCPNKLLKRHLIGMSSRSKDGTSLACILDFPRLDRKSMNKKSMVRRQFHWWGKIRPWMDSLPIAVHLDLEQARWRFQDRLLWIPHPTSCWVLSSRMLAE